MTCYLWRMMKCNFSKILHNLPAPQNIFFYLGKLMHFNAHSETWFSFLGKRWFFYGLLRQALGSNDEMQIFGNNLPSHSGRRGNSFRRRRLYSLSRRHSARKNSGTHHQNICIKGINIKYVEWTVQRWGSKQIWVQFQNNKNRHDIWMPQSYRL
jgi:hypothetical protein